MSTCPACDLQLHKAFTARDHTVSHEDFELLACHGCGLMKTDFPTGKTIGSYYQSADYISHTSKATSAIQRLYLLVRGYTLYKKYNLINSLKAPARSIADIGCGTGDFLNRMKRGGWEISGIEPSDQARAIAEQTTGITLGKDLRAFHAKTAIITLWHVLEHLDSPMESMKKLSENLMPGGTILIAVPNHNAEDAQYYKEHWAGLDVPRHLWHFTQQAINGLSEKAGLRVERTVPLKFDAYYVSMLSEGYKNVKQSSITNLIKGSWSGLKSNLRAANTGEYSSLIYILKK